MSPDTALFLLTMYVVSFVSALILAIRSHRRERKTYRLFLAEREHKTQAFKELTRCKLLLHQASESLGSTESMTSSKASRP